MRKSVVYALAALAAVVLLLVTLVNACRSTPDPSREEAYREQTGQEQSDGVDENPGESGATGQQQSPPPRSN